MSKATQQATHAKTPPGERSNPSGVIQLSTFRLENELFGLDALRVQEILPYQQITAVPLAPDYVKGLINLRGQIVTVLDLRQRLGFEPLEAETSGMNLIVNSEEGLMSLLVDSIGNVLDMHTDQLQSPPGTIRGVAVHYIDSVCQLEDELLIVLNTDTVLELEA